MSFCSDVKKELLLYYDDNIHCYIQELRAIIIFQSKILDENTFEIRCENTDILQRVKYFFKAIFDLDINIICENKVFKMTIHSLKKIFKTIKLEVFEIKNEFIINDIEQSLRSCCKRAYIRSSFICIGYISNPEKNYHLEFVNSSIKEIQKLKNIVNSFNIDSKIIERKGIFVLYIKEGEQIVDLLNIMNAHKSLVLLENVRILKDVRNNINRIVNCETANLNKIVSASVSQRENIEYIKKTVGLDYLPNQLKIVANLRLEFPDASLKELGEIIQPSIGKSGINHRLNKINIIAENIRRGSYD